MINESNDERRYDFIVVGAGAAGSVLGAELPASARKSSSSFEMAEYRACTSISIPTIQVMMKRGFDGVRVVSGEIV